MQAECELFKFTVELFPIKVQGLTMEQKGKGYTENQQCISCNKYEFCYAKACEAFYETS